MSEDKGKQNLQKMRLMIIAKKKNANSSNKALQNNISNQIIQKETSLKAAEELTPKEVSKLQVPNIAIFTKQIELEKQKQVKSQDLQIDQLPKISQKQKGQMRQQGELEDDQEEDQPLFQSRYNNQTIIHKNQLHSTQPTIIRHEILPQSLQSIDPLQVGVIEQHPYKLILESQKNEREKERQIKKIHENDLYEEYLRQNEGQNADHSQEKLIQVQEQKQQQNLEQKQEKQNKKHQNLQSVELIATANMLSSHEKVEIPKSAEIISTQKQPQLTHNSFQHSHIPEKSLQKNNLASRQSLSGQAINALNLGANSSQQVHHHHSLNHSLHQTGTNSLYHYQNSQHNPKQNRYNPANSSKKAVKVILKQLDMIKASIHNMNVAYRGIQYLREQVKKDQLLKKRIRERLNEFSQASQFQILRKIIKTSSSDNHQTQIGFNKQDHIHGNEKQLRKAAQNLQKSNPISNVPHEIQY